jgi:tetratricopeptide (TPR) repeat protein
LVKTKRATTSPVQAAQAFLEQGQLNQAEDVLVPYIAKHPKNTVAYLLLADISARRGAWDEAVEILEQVIRIDAATPNAYAKLGEAALASGHMTRALEALQRAHDADSQDVSVLKNLWKIAQRRDDKVLQKTVLQKLIVLAPDDPEVHLLAESVEARQEEQTPAA